MLYSLLIDYTLYVSNLLLESSIDIAPRRGKLNSKKFSVTKPTTKKVIKKKEAPIILSNNDIVSYSSIIYT